MGFSALDGMPMGTRSGQLDPGVILHFLDRGMSAAEITTLLYKQSGLLGLSGLSHDMRTLAEFRHEGAR
jgi:acetate kinase